MPVPQALRSLDAREAALRAQLEARQRELAELQAAAVGRLAPGLVAQAQQLEGAAARCRAAVKACETAGDSAVRAWGLVGAGRGNRKQVLLLPAVGEINTLGGPWGQAGTRMGVRVGYRSVGASWPWDPMAQERVKGWSCCWLAYA